MNGGSDVYLMDDPPGNGGQPVAALSPLLETGEGRRGRGQHHRQEHPGHSQHVRHGHAQLSPICQPESSQDPEPLQGQRWVDYRSCE